MIELSQQQRTGWLVVSVTGRADAEAADELQNGLTNALELSAKVAADFSALDYISSAGLRAVLQAARAAQNRSAEFAGGAQIAASFVHRQQYDLFEHGQHGSSP